MIPLVTPKSLDATFIPIPTLARHREQSKPTGHDSILLWCMHGLEQYFPTAPLVTVKEFPQPSHFENLLPFGFGPLLLFAY
jgi:hypothetical protein